MEVSGGKPYLTQLIGDWFGSWESFWGRTSWKWSMKTALEFGPVLLNSSWVSEWLVALCWASPEVSWFGSPRWNWASIFFKDDTPGLPKWTATDLILDLKCEVPILFGYCCKI